MNKLRNERKRKNSLLINTPSDSTAFDAFFASQHRNVNGHVAYYAMIAHISPTLKSKSESADRGVARLQKDSSVSRHHFRERE